MRDTREAFSCGTFCTSRDTDPTVSVGTALIWSKDYGAQQTCTTVVQGWSASTDHFWRHELRHWNWLPNFRWRHRNYPHVHAQLALPGKPLFNFSRGGKKFSSVVEHDFSGWCGGGGTAANSRQHSHIATHEVNTQTPCTQANMGGVVAVFNASCGVSCRLRVEFALWVWWFGHRKSTVWDSLRYWRKKIQDFFSRPVAHIGGFYRPKPNLHCQESPYFIFLGYLRPHSRPQNTLKKQKWSVEADHPCR